MALKSVIQGHINARVPGTDNPMSSELTLWADFLAEVFPAEVIDDTTGATPITTPLVTGLKYKLIFKKSGNTVQLNYEIKNENNSIVNFGNIATIDNTAYRPKTGNTYTLNATVIGSQNYLQVSGSSIILGAPLAPNATLIGSSTYTVND